MQTIRNPDEIEPLGKNTRKEEVFKYKKRIGVLYIICKALRLSGRGNKLVFETMYKQK